MTDETDNQKPGTSAGTQPPPIAEVVAEGEVEAVTFVRIPPFIRTKPKMWFIQIEAIFARRNIKKSVTMFNEVISNLEPDVLLSLEDLFELPVEERTYTALKERLIAQYSETNVKRMNRLLQDLELGDKKPTVLLREMRSLASNQITDEFLRNMWLQMLPVTARTILTVHNGSLEDVASMADIILESSPNTGHVNAVDKAVQPKHDVDLVENMKRLQAMVEALTKTVNRLKATDQPRGRSRQRSQSPGARGKSAGPSGQCFYHRRWADKATKCTLPCSFKSSGNE